MNRNTKIWNDLTLQQRLTATTEQIQKGGNRMDKLNNFFFPLEKNERLSWHDAIWFYGGLLIFVLIIVFTFIKL